MRVIGAMLTGVMGLLWGGYILMSIGVNLFVMYDWMGGFGIILGLFLFPLAMVAAPWYALFAMDWLLPLLLTYIPFVILMAISVVARDD